jgi:hypothetical protein
MAAKKQRKDKRKQQTLCERMSTALATSHVPLVLHAVLRESNMLAKEVLKAKVRYDVANELGTQPHQTSPGYKTWMSRRYRAENVLFDEVQRGALEFATATVLQRAVYVAMEDNASVEDRRRDRGCDDEIASLVQIALRVLRTCPDAPNLQQSSLSSAERLVLAMIVLLCETRPGQRSVLSSVSPAKDKNRAS